MQVVLVMFRSDGERRSFSVVRNMTVIGRREDCDLRIPVGDVSRKHCRLVRTDDGIRIEDLGSSNGTHVNGQRIQESDLNAGDVVSIGPVKFIVQIDGVPTDEELVAPEDTLIPQADESSMMGAPATMPGLPPEGSGLDEASEEFQIEEEPAATGELEDSAAESPEILPQESSDHSSAQFPGEPLEKSLEESPLELSEAPALPELPALEPEPLEPAEDDFQLQDEASAGDDVGEHTFVKQSAPQALDPLELEQSTPPADEIESVDLDAGDESEWDFVVEESASDKSEHNFQVDLDSTHEQPHGKA
jgi:hypothetical protein